ncbi:MAG: ACP S-malonyltransferase [Gammaproteobacteria bacterium]|nr:ACP S-malonyltransferase [Gammaproteobacteria bacterium]
MLTYIFPGQGSQAKGMGANLFDEFPLLTQQADKILGYSIKTLCLEDPDQHLNHTQYTQPALYCVNAFSYLKKIQSEAVRPDYVSGHSLGEYNALFAAEVFDFTTGLTLVKKRGELMSEAIGGGMAAIIGLKVDLIKQILTEHQLFNINVANHNSHLQNVISGPKKDIDTAQRLFEKMESVMYIPLKVSGAFHSLFMLSAQHQFTQFLNQFRFAIPTIPVLSNLNAKPYHPATLHHNLSNQITHSVQWISIMEYLLQHDDMNIEEVGPGSVLTGLLRRIKNGQ